ncbi:double-strand break repair helicase AddA [Jannaschia ovalis]|uniref:DNA 3'-5' helicase n=1 Tax=Jannaschia ovalis TaxID=3038773 RepID=A0ABY8L7V3_9RHOB|nr:double-strand break repair helicase AddA [Jannaschia sp. GRR-S6-38]WGH77457.1 double-strand break repair helicase AddA [Jannaschia sp. GRR-S6-38]
MMDDLPPPDDATRAQIRAADPSGSVWLSANAGSGKTRVLTDRVAWLLLEGTPPERILCLTFTKAAAGEMQNRLFKRLGEWTMLGDDALRIRLQQLGVERGRVDTDALRRARTLFARAIEAPGGLKIQTIHAFCAGLLRRFPLEAGVTPAFTEMDEITAARLHADILDGMAADPTTRPLVDAVAAKLSDGDPGAFLAAVLKHRDGLGGWDEAGLRAALGIADASAAEVRGAAVTPADLDLLEVVRDAAGRADGKTMSDLSTRLAEAYLADPPDRFDLLCTAFLKKDGDPRANLVTKPVAAEIGEAALDDLRDLACRLTDAQARLAALEGFGHTRALHAFGPVFAERVEAAKRARGWLDFDDQIRRARALLSTRDMAQWVLFKLDGGIDHILVDEAQDTSPAQWDVIAALSQEFGAGIGARPELVRTLFVVGDRKQSIYRFQGADPGAFDRMRAVFGDRLTDPPLTDHALLHSFRSAPVILDLVDAVFETGGGVGDAPQHIAFNRDLPGRVDLWPPIPKAEPDLSDRRWYDPVDRPAPNDADVRLARRVAEAIRAMVDARAPIVHRGVRRAVDQGDILVLFQRRDRLFFHVIRACKAAGLNLAGADRLVLTRDMAVRDLLALLRWLDAPGDDLSLATVLRSPLGGMDEAGLYDLAHGRAGRLWDRLRDEGPRATVAMLRDLLARADRLRPFELLQRMLIRHDGRRLLLARLGAGSGEAIDALLAQALAYEAAQVPSLAGFLGWLDSAAPEVKRRPGAGAIRVMTVHGAKGLEAPVVILPETMKRDLKTPQGVQRLPGDGPAIWMPPKAQWSPAARDLAEATQAADAAERERLLYVALTRAESWLIAGAAGEVGDAPGDSWWRRIEAGLRARGAGPLPTPEGDGLRLEAGDWTPLPAADAPDPTAPRDAPLPFLETPPQPPARPAGRLTPSDLPGAKTLPGESAGRPDALDRGTAIHALLEHLPALPPADRAAAAEAILADLPGRAAILAEAEAVLDAPDLAHLFAPGTLAELAFALPAEGTRPPVFGTMDRVILAPDRVTIVDYKTNAVLPDAPGDVPAGLLRQMAAYELAARAIWPGRAVELAILWTRAPRLMALPGALLRDAWAEMPAIDPAADGA